VSFASEPGRDDGNLPPVNVVIPDDARELDRDVLAYHRELRARRRRQRLMRLMRPFRVRELGGHAAMIPLIAACLAISLVGGALLSVATISPASAPTLSVPPTSGQAPVSASGVSASGVSASGVSPGDLTKLPAGTVHIGGRTVTLRSLVTSAIAVIPASCGCGPELERLAQQAVSAHVALYFAGAGPVIPQLPALVKRYGDGAAIATADYDGALGSAFHPTGLTVLLVFSDARAEVRRDLRADFQLTPVLRELNRAGASLGTSQPTAS
jgi:hypothetical protein